MRQRSVMKHQFSKVPSANISRSSFDRSHGYKTTFDAGHLVPVFVDEALPGDTFSLRMHAFGRLATQIFPVMDNMFLDSFFFAVPYRLLWENWERFNGSQDNPDDTTDYLIPQVTAPVGGWPLNSVGDYFGIPTLVDPLPVNAVPFRAYNLIFNQWFRDENLIDSLPVSLGDGPDDPADYVIKSRGKRHDYFTSCLPWPQKGPAVELPLGDSAPVTGIGSGSQTPISGTNDMYITDGTGAIQSNEAWHGASAGANTIYMQEDPNNPGFPDVRVDLSAATAATINQLRQSFQIQKLYERDARGGTRYTEIVLSHFGVSSPDARLQRAEYLGGGTTSINVNPVPQTSSTNDSQGPVDSPQANLASYATVNVSGHGFHKSFTEHCILIGMVSVRADLTYQQGLNRMWSRQTRWDHFWPALQMIGEQVVYNREIWAQGTPDDDLAFGYQERFAEYRYKPSMITGEFRSDAPESLDAWHLSQDFAGLPLLDETFITEDPPIDRIIATPDEPHFLFDAYFKLKCARPMPVYSVPGLIDHF